MGDLLPLSHAAVRGALPPLLVRILDGAVYIVDGERRTRAALLAIERGDTVPPISCISEPRGFTDTDRTLCLLECNSGKPLTILEESRVIARLREIHELDEKDIAARTGRSRTHIKNCMSLLAVPEEIHRAIEKGKITASLVIDLITETKGDPDALLSLVRSALEKAKEKGKDSASRKDLPEKPEVESPGASGESQNPPVDDPASLNPEPPKTENLTGVAAIKAADSNMGAGPNARTGEGGTADSRVVKLNKMLEKLDRESCNATLWDFTELLIDYLDNKRPITDIKKQIVS
jgi:ParB/RepB/Spo0J family partition protein